jgi:hypothetical protein
MDFVPMPLPVHRPRQWKIALSLAVVGGLAAPFAFRTYKADPTYLLVVPLTAHEKEQFANYLRTDDCDSFDDLITRFFCDDSKRAGKGDFKWSVEGELAAGATSELHDDRPKYWIMNVGIAAATAASLFGLVFLIPMLARGIAFLARRYWKWLNA